MKSVGRGKPSRKWQGFIECRRRYISDLTWLGLGFMAIGFGDLGVESGWTRVFLVGCGLLGVVMVLSGVCRAWRRVDPVSHEQRPSRPW